MMQPLKIYLGDLTYDTTSLSTDAFPLNVGYIASYCLKEFGTDVEISLFKYITELDKAVHESPPDILALSNYCWNQRVGQEFFSMVKKINPNTLCVWGGPNFPIDIPSQEKFMSEFPEVDVYVSIEGEIGFRNIVEIALQSKSKHELKDKVLSQPIDGCISRDKTGKLQYSIPVGRKNNLDEIPSPYKTGLMDKFFDGRLTPMIQTNRGCPFSCTFCTDGQDTVRKINNFSLERIAGELEYIGTKVAKNIHGLIISDLNFGMYTRDSQICDSIVDTQKKYDYPHYVSASTGKNSQEKIITAIESLKGSLQLMMAVQSMDNEVLTNIRRDNISVDRMMELAPAIKKSGLNTKSEVILGLPGETYQSHVNTIRDLVRAQMDEILIFTCMMLPGSEMATPESRKKWKLNTKFRILPRDFAQLSNGKKILEVEEVVIGSTTLSFEEYVELRLLSFIVFTTNREIVYTPLLKFLRENNIDVFELFFRMLKKIKTASMEIGKMVTGFTQSVRDELWDSPEEIQAHFQNENEYKKLLTGEAGINVLNNFRAVCTLNMDDWTEYVLSIANDFIREKKSSDETFSSQFYEIANFCRGLSHNPLGKDRLSTNLKFEFHYDIQSWLRDTTNIKLDQFMLQSPNMMDFIFTDEQYKIVQDTLDTYGKSISSVALALARISSHMLWRTPMLSDQTISTITVKNLS
jgi:tRNA A37 methylthiotransferase MiaB